MSYAIIYIHGFLLYLDNLFSIPKYVWSIQYIIHDVLSPRKSLAHYLMIYWNCRTWPQWNES